MKQIESASENVSFILILKMTNWLYEKQFNLYFIYREIFFNIDLKIVFLTHINVSGVLFILLIFAL